MSDKKRESRSRRLVTIRVTPMTYRHLCAMAEVSGLKFPARPWTSWCGAWRSKPGNCGERTSDERNEKF